MARTPLSVIRPRIRLGETIVVGPGKVELLRAVAEQGSISGAARAQGMTYKRAWSLLNELNAGLGTPVIESVAGGRGGGGAAVTPFGHALVDAYAAIEAACEAAARPELDRLQRRLRQPKVE